MENVRSAGVLLHLTSLPGPYGIGVMGEEARQFVLQLQRMSFHYWQVLPLCPVDDTGSPYCACSANAGYPALIDPRDLVEEGLLTAQEAENNRYSGSIYITDHRFALEKRLQTLRLAFSRLNDAHREQLRLFAAQNAWVNDYALYPELKEKHGGLPWWEWPDSEKHYEQAVQHTAALQQEIDFHIFCQFVFFTQ